MSRYFRYHYLLHIIYTNKLLIIGYLSSLSLCCCCVAGADDDAVYSMYSAVISVKNVSSCGPGWAACAHIWEEGKVTAADRRRAAVAAPPEEF